MEDRRSSERIPEETLRRQALEIPSVMKNLGNTVRSMVGENDKDGLKRILRCYGLDIVAESILATRSE